MGDVPYMHIYSCPECGEEMNILDEDLDDLLCCLHCEYEGTRETSFDHVDWLTKEEAEEMKDEE
jgi:hypothetical protein